MVLWEVECVQIDICKPAPEKKGLAIPKKSKLFSQKIKVISAKNALKAG